MAFDRDIQEALLDQNLETLSSILNNKGVRTIIPSGNPNKIYVEGYGLIAIWNKYYENDTSYRIEPLDHGWTSEIEINELVGHLVDVITLQQ